MKKISLLLFIAGVLSVLSCVTAQAATGAAIDKSQTSKGVLVVSLTDFSGKTIKAQVAKGSEKYTYTLTRSVSNLPLQMGTGEYKISVLENIAGDKYIPLVTDTVSIASLDEKEVFKASIPIIEYSASTKAVPAFKKLTDEQTAELDKINAVYNNIINNYSYDFDKAASIKTDYVPVIDDVYEAKKGVCYDYASLMSGVLRSLGIPTKLVMGYRSEVDGYHAWNVILIGDAWIHVDTTYDAQVINAGKTPTMKKDESKITILKIY